MSTYWDVRCLDCDAESGLHLNHGDSTCRGLILSRNALAALSDSELLSAADISITVPGERGYVDPSFYNTHAGHVLAAVSEYGDIDGDCIGSRATEPSSPEGLSAIGTTPTGTEVGE